jgi:hypothetical protein
MTTDGSPTDEFNMRDATNVKEVTVEVSGKRGKVDSFWVTENNDIYVKVKQGSVSVNYRLTQLNEDMKVYRKAKFEDE